MSHAGELSPRRPVGQFSCRKNGYFLDPHLLYSPALMVEDRRSATKESRK